jgi:hypothetical protein
MRTGWQRLACEHRHNHGRQVWTGEYPGDEECREFDWWTTSEYRPGLVEDLNRLAWASRMGEVVWSVERQRWVKP